MDARAMNETITLHKPAQSGVDPEPFQRVGDERRAYIWRMSNDEALRLEARFALQATHLATVMTDDDYVPDGLGSRIIRRAQDGQEFAVLKVVEEGMRHRGGRYRYQRLILAEVSPSVVT